MLVSAIITTKNRPTELRTALDSIVRQTYQKLEIIVVDNESTPDNSVANKRLVETIGRKCIYVSLTNDGVREPGPSHTRNIGIERATGELVGFCDDDDYWCDDRNIEAAVASFSADPSLDFLFANQEAHANGKLVRNEWLPLLVTSLAERMPPIGMSVRLSRKDSLIDDHAHMNTCVFRRDFLLKIGGFWESVRYLEDLDLFVRAVDAARHIEYRHQTVSIHNIPNRTLAKNASTQLDQTGKYLVEINVANHLIQLCQTREARHYANRFGGFAYRHLSLNASRLDHNGAAYSFAKFALLMRPTTKWFFYTTLLGIKALLALPWIKK